MLAEAPAHPNTSTSQQTDTSVCMYQGSAPVLPTPVHVLQVAEASPGAGGGGVGVLGVAEVVAVQCSVSLISFKIPIFC